MRSTYPDYFEKQKTTDALPYSTREAHFANYTNKLKLQIGATHMGGGTFIKVGGGTSARWKEILANFVVWIGNCDVTSDVITYTPYEGLNYTILDKTTPLSKPIGEPLEIQTGCHRGDPSHWCHSG